MVKARNIKRQLFGYRIQQQTKHSCAISVEKAALYSQCLRTNTARAPQPHAIMKSPCCHHSSAASQPHPPYQLQPDPLRVNTMNNMRLLKTTRQPPR